MNYNFSFKINKNSFIINQIEKRNSHKDLNKTDIIEIKELKFSPDYIKENTDLVASFLNVIILKKNINLIELNINDSLDIIMDLINKLNNINSLIFNNDIDIKYDIFMKLLDNKSITYIECYTMPSYFIERLDLLNNIKVKIRKRKKYNSKFMKENFLSSYSDLYYRKYIIITYAFDLNEFKDFHDFILINNKIRTIRFIKFDNSTFAYILDELKNADKSKINIIIDQKDNDLDIIYKSVPFIKKSYNKYLQENNIKIKINYSKEYKINNFLKEYNIKLLTSIVFITIIFGFLVFTIDSYNKYKDSLIVSDQIDEISTLIEDNSDNVDENDEEIDVIGETTSVARKSYYSSTYYTNFTNVFSELSKINSDTVGYLKVNNTRINYPVVQASDNSYYLNHDFKKKKNSMGWIFMDYRNTKDVLDRNTILYGHNIKGGIMFGNISNMFNKSWWSKSQNQIITFNIPGHNMKWKIISMYKIKETTDYLDTVFDSDDAYLNFLNMIKNRTLVDFGYIPNANDKILTLSTCFTSNTRHVIHAVLIEDKSDVERSTVPITESPTLPTTTTTNIIGQ